MPTELANVKTEALSLPEHERAELVKDLLMSLDGPADPDVKKAWDIEICRRINEIESGNAKLFDAEDSLENIKQRLHLN